MTGDMGIDSCCDDSCMLLHELTEHWFALSGDDALTALAALHLSQTAGHWWLMRRESTWLML